MFPWLSVLILKIQNKCISATVLDEFKGTIQIDRYEGYNAVVEQNKFTNFIR